MEPNNAAILADVRKALIEDVGTGDVTATLLPNGLNVNAKIISREPMLVCGQAWVNCTFAEIDSKIELQWLVEEGKWLDKPMELCRIHGLACNILAAERTALNFLQTLSGTATQVHFYVEKLQGHQARLLDTRKTLPGLRLAQKYAVSCAGGQNHRLGLYDAYLIKENHIKACGSIKKATKIARDRSDNLMVEVEVETLNELQEALEAKPDRILLDNFTHQMMVEAVAMNQFRQCELEASGGVSLETIESIAETGVDFISVGEMTKSVRAIDLSLLIVED